MRTLDRFLPCAAVVALLMGCSGPINDGTVASKPTGYLCQLLGPDYISMPSEQEAIFRELERRGAECLPSRRIVVQVQ